MSRYYFDVREGGRATVDNEGLELADILGAEREAIASAAAIASELFPTRGTDEVTIDVRDTARPVLSVSIALRIQRP
jgi:hypothetical protein